MSDTQLVGDSDIMDLPVGGGEDGEELTLEAFPEEKESDADLLIQSKKFVFQALFEKASSVVPTKDIMPVLKNFYIEAKPGNLRVVATDLELSVVSFTEMVQVGRSGTAVFPAKKMLEILREAEDEEMIIDVQNGVANVTVGKTHWTLKLQNGDDYPPLPEIADVDLYETDRVKFLGSLNAVRGAAAADSTRPSLMMINVEDGKMTACDGVRFQQTKLEDGFPLDLQIPIGAVQDIVKLLRTTDLEQIGIGETDFHLVFRVGQDVFIANKLMAQFPNVEEMLLQPALRNTDELLVDRAELEAAVKRVKINADPETSAIILSLSKDLITVQTKDKFGNSSEEQVEASWSASDKDIVVNHKFLMEMLDMFDVKSCKFLLGEDTKTRKSPVLLKDDDTQTVGIIQQMRSDWVTDKA